MGRSWRARLRSSSIAWFTSRFSSATSCACAGRRVLGQRLEPQQDRRERLVHLVVEVAREPAALLLLRAHHELAGAAALLLHPVEQSLEGLGEPADLLGGPVRAEVERVGRGGVHLLDALDQALQRPEAALEHPHVHAEREHDREREHQELPALARHLEVEAGHEAGGQQGERHEQRRLRPRPGR